MNTTDQNQEQDSDQDIARLLEAAGPRESVPQELKDRWEVHFRSELKAAGHSRTKPYRLPAAALAAGLLAFAIVLPRLSVNTPEEAPISIAAVTGVATLSNEGQRQPASAGDQVAADSVLATGEASFVGVDWAGFDIRLNEGTRLRLKTDRLELELGEIYISSVGRQTTIDKVTVVTPIATVRDIGTQFKVHFDGSVLTTAVREGGIELAVDGDIRFAEATPEDKPMLRVGEDGSVNVKPDTSDWTWIYTVAPSFSLEGASVREFLRWATGESGQTLEFADSAIELSAEHTRLSGAMDLEALDPAQAIDVVLSTTRFEAERRGDSLLVVRRRLE